MRGRLLDNLLWCLVGNGLNDRQVEKRKGGLTQDQWGAY